MIINYLKNSKFLVISAFLTISNIILITSVAQAQPKNKSLKFSIESKSQITSLNPRENRSLDFNLLLSRSFSRQTEDRNFEQQNDFELSEIKQTIPLGNQPLIASSFGGKASWYGPGFHGRLTANGERYNQNAMTAAHRNLRFGTRVKVTNLNNGRSVILRINDRGPYIKGRVIDVSAAAARSLGMIHSGVAPVKVTVLGR